MEFCGELKMRRY